MGSRKRKWLLKACTYTHRGCNLFDEYNYLFKACMSHKLLHILIQRETILFCYLLFFKREIACLVWQYVWTHAKKIMRTTEQILTDHVGEFQIISGIIQNTKNSQIGIITVRLSFVLQKNSN